MGCGCSLLGRRRLTSRRAEWAKASADDTVVIVRAISGTVVYRQENATFDTAIEEVLSKVCQENWVSQDCVRLCAGGTSLKPGLCLGDCVLPTAGEPVELLLVRLAGPPIKVEAMSGLPIKLLEEVPPVGTPCHCDRNYKFTSLGDFADKPNMKYVMTSNDDKSTPSDSIMWRVDMKVPAMIYLNFRSDWHASRPGTGPWLERGGWALSDLRSTVSTGVPNGPYAGPVYSKRVEPGIVDLMGSNCGEGTYFVFIELE